MITNILEDNENLIEKKAFTKPEEEEEKKKVLCMIIITSVSTLVWLLVNFLLYFNIIG